MDPCIGKRDSMYNLESTKMPFKLLKVITDDFSEERFLGSGTFGKVYKGVLENGEEIAVKVFCDMAAIDDESFTNEFQNLARLKHQNIVQLVGYCNESEKQFFVLDDGTQVNAEKMHLALCLEYVDNGSLHKHISDENQGHEWHIRYNIIKGICEGLKHLREGLESPVWHLDLKPDNILLNKEMIPKIADFGLSRLIGDEGTRKTLNYVGTRGYCPPEYVRLQMISEAFDIFSLGVIIAKIMIGNEGYHNFADMLPRKLVKHVHNNWKKRLQETVKPRSLEVYCKQAKTCIEMASKCLNEDRKQRPSIQEIVIALNETETMILNPPFQIEQFLDGESILPSSTSFTFKSSPEGEDKASRSGHAKNIRSNHPYVMMNYSYELIRKITNDFSEDRLLAEGDNATVYKGVYEDGRVIAVKILHHFGEFNSEQFQNMLENMAMIQHKNIIQSIGYCDETEEEHVEHNGRTVIIQKIHRALCLEYMQNGSLLNHISDEFHGLDWCRCYKIIKGTCEGLRHLHEELPYPILHLDLKPSNILLDENMVPKIADLSRLFLEEFTIGIMSPSATFESPHLPPEYINKQVISAKFDIYSLGVIIILQMVAGMSGSSLLAEMTSQEFIKHVIKS